MFSPLHHLRPTTERRNIKKNFRGGFLNFIKQNYTERRKTERKKFLYVFTITSSGQPQREEIFFRERKILGGLLNFISFQYATMNE